MAVESVVTDPDSAVAVAFALLRDAAAEESMPGITFGDEIMDPSNPGLEGAVAPIPYGRPLEINTRKVSILTEPGGIGKPVRTRSALRKFINKNKSVAIGRKNIR